MNRAALTLTALVVAVALAVYPRPASAQSSRPACNPPSVGPSCTLGVVQAATVRVGRQTGQTASVVRLAAYHPTLTKDELCAAITRSSAEVVATGSQALYNCGAETSTTPDGAPAVGCVLSSLIARCDLTIAGVPQGGWIDVVANDAGLVLVSIGSTTPHPTTTTSTTSTTSTTVPVTTTTTTPPDGTWADGPEGEFRVGVVIALALLVFAAFARLGIEA